MHARTLLVAALVAVPAFPSLAAAQDAVCTITPAASPVAGFAADACQKAYDFSTFVMPQLGQALAGGGAIIGTANTLGGLGKFSINLRATAVQGRLPEIDQVTLTNGRNASRIPTTESPVPAPVVDVGIGILPGFARGFLSLDGVVNVAYLPEGELEDVTLRTPSGRLAVGYGGRLGLTRDGKGLPAISVSYIRRDLPTADLAGSFSGGTGGQDSLALTGFKVRTQSARVSLSKKLGFLELGGGYGRDRYNTDLAVRARVSETVLNVTSTATAAFAQSLEVDREVFYGSVAVNFPVLKIAAEVGQHRGGTQLTTFNTFVDGKQNEPRLFASAGLRISF
jgi:hypothetical protein